jgi:putative transposase
LETPETPETPETEETPETDASAADFRMRKVRLRLSREQSLVLRRWMGGARFVYNKAVEHVRGGNKVDRSELRRRFSAQNSDLVDAYPWLAEVPYKIREQATDDVYKAQKANLARKKNDPKHRKWTFKFKNRRNPSAWTIGVVSQAFNLASVEPRPETRKPRRDGAAFDECGVRDWTRLRLFRDRNNALGDFWAVEAIPPGVLSGKKGICAIQRDCRITMDGLGRFYLCVPIPVTKRAPAKPAEDRSVVALDPGVRAFQTYYSPEEHGSYAEGDFSRVFSLCKKIDRDASLQATDPSMRSACATRQMRARHRIRNLVDEVHKKVSLDLVTRFDTVLIPEFKSKDMVQRRREDGRRRCINSKTARSMLTWAHYRFKERLKHKASEHGKEVVVVTEEYTSKTCGKCGFVNAKFSSKTFKCASCGVEMDRDANGARNIFLKQLASPAA